MWGVEASNSALDNSLGAWDGVNLIALSGATWDRVTAVGTWHGKLVVAGDVRFPKQASISTVAAFDGTTWQVLGTPGVSSWVSRVAEFQGDLYVGGGILWDEAGPYDGVARFDGSAWGPLGLGVDESVSALCADGERLLVAGDFMNAGGQWIPTLAAWDGQSWTAPTSTPAWRVYNFDVYNGQICVPDPQGVAMWDGQTWTILETPAKWKELGVGNVSRVKAVGGDLYVAMNTCWSYVTIEGEGEGGEWCLMVANLARWDGVQWRLFEGSWVERAYTAIEPYGQEILVGQHWRYTLANPVARLSPTGAPWFIDQPRDATVEAGGALTLTAATISGYDADGPISFQWLRNGEPLVDGAGGASPGGGIVSDGSGVFNASFSTTLVITGARPSDAGDYRCVMTNACGTVESLTARIDVVSPCRADFNASGTVNSTDVSDFINAWFEDQAAGSLVTDWDANGVVNSTDVSTFINAWLEDTTLGCG